MTILIQMTNLLFTYEGSQPMKTQGYNSLQVVFHFHVKSSDEKQHFSCFSCAFHFSVVLFTFELLFMCFSLFRCFSCTFHFFCAFHMLLLFRCFSLHFSGAFHMKSGSFHMKNTAFQNWTLGLSPSIGLLIYKRPINL